MHAKFTFLLLCASVVLSFTTDEFLQIIGENEELKIKNESHSTKDDIYDRDGYVNETFEEFQNSTRYKDFIKFIENGHTLESLTFNIYDNNMRDAAMALFNLMRHIEKNILERLLDVLRNDINKNMLQYVCGLLPPFSFRNNYDALCTCPPFTRNPKYFTNAETIVKANRLILVNGTVLHEDLEQNQIFKTDDVISINTNYSGWNLMKNSVLEKLNYFREDVGLNSYYLGVNMLHPFWMSNRELDEMHPRHAERYFYIHQQLYARYLLEATTLKDENVTQYEIKDYDNYNSYLRYDNGLQFPVRYFDVGINDQRWTYIKSMQMLFRETLSRGFVMMNDGIMNVSEENHTNLLARLIREKYDSKEKAKIIRSFFGANGYPENVYNPAPSTLHHPETALRDPVYWKMIEGILSIFYEYRENFMPSNLTQYETDEYEILRVDAPNVVTYFEYYQYNINRGLFYPCTVDNYLRSITFTARQRRLQHEPFSINITMESSVTKDVIVRMFIGPSCMPEECFKDYTKFFELDHFKINLQNGKNVISWSPNNSSNLSNDNKFNYEYKNDDDDNKVNESQEYSIYKFPERLIMPKGTEEGLPLKLFIMINDVVIISRPKHEQPSEKCEYKNYYNEIDHKPFGFPFHRFMDQYNENANNYGFYDIMVYHKKSHIDESGYFSPHLY